MEIKNNRKLLIAGGIILVIVLIIARTGLDNFTNTDPQQTSSVKTQTSKHTSDEISSKEASLYIGQSAKVCGPVVDSRYASKSKGQPTFLNFDYPYPNHTFTIVIWGSDRANFTSPPETKYMSKNVCISGFIETYKGKPQSQATSEIMINIK